MRLEYHFVKSSTEIPRLRFIQLTENLHFKCHVQDSVEVKKFGQNLIITVLILIENFTSKLKFRVFNSDIALALPVLSMGAQHSAHGQNVSRGNFKFGPQRPKFHAFCLFTSVKKLPPPLNGSKHINVRPFFWPAVRFELCTPSLDQRCPTHSPLATCGEWLCSSVSKYLKIQLFGIKTVYLTNKSQFNLHFYT